MFFVLCRYPGFHFIPPKENPEFTLIYDKNGFIAGMQSLVSQTADTSHYDFENADWYEKDEIEGRKKVVEEKCLQKFCFFKLPVSTWNSRMTLTKLPPKKRSNFFSNF